MIHLMICPNHLAYGGTQLSVRHWLPYLDRDKYRVTILAMGRGGLSESFESLWPVVYDDNNYPNIERHIAELKPDLIHFCVAGGPDLEYVSRAAKLAPVTETVMCPRPASNAAEVSGVTVISEYVKILQPPGQQVAITELPYDPNAYPTEASFDRAHFGIPEETLLVGSFGNHRAENAHFMKLVRDFDRPGVHFAIRSDMRYPYWRGRNRITVLRQRFSEAEKIAFFRLLDVFLYPTSNEAYGLVFLEAMAQKTPVVSYADSCIPGTVGPGGLLAARHDRRHLRAQLDRLLDDADLRQRIGAAGAQLVAERNDPQHIADQFDAFFSHALANAKRGRYSR
ncbi:glycosyltransferase family 4 protein [Magnetofaba australis]|uniref:Putative D-inositol-3-phosphate glycosyltransferase n=1 Tax=Magnetofaba australis IT-1 TaxID=1434232 RepID=A0A1Y2K494_9PROT|nr:glycosyltransferase family 4 protein [Magnetofaba australis]OSM04049.1 putative D-inositol-3-phosphate glycosyltransferase [Magnetofaba australis IT-1]